MGSDIRPTWAQLPAQDLCRLVAPEPRVLLYKARELRERVWAMPGCVESTQYLVTSIKYFKRCQVAEGRLVLSSFKMTSNTLCAFHGPDIDLISFNLLNNPLPSMMLLSPSSRRQCYSPPQRSLLGEPPPPESREAKPFLASGDRGAGRQGLECPRSREPLGD